MKKLLMTASVYAHIRNFHLPYLHEFQTRGWETHVACAGIPSAPPYTDRAIELPFVKQMFSVSNYRAAMLLRKLIQEEQYDLVITHTSLASFFTRLAVKNLRKRPKLINVMHGYLFDDDTPYLRRQLLLGAERLTAPETDLLLLMNEWDFETAKKYRLGRRIEKIHGMGVDFSRLDKAAAEDGRRLRETLGIPKEAFVLLYPAEFSERKSQHVLIEAMQFLPRDVMLVLCGEGDGLLDCRQIAEKLHVQDRVLFPGQVRDVASWYRMADALTASSRSEGLPFNVMEAMCMGLPVIASAVKGHTDLIEDGVTGFLYPYGEAEKCAACIERLLEDEPYQKQIAVNASAAVRAYALQEVMPHVMDLFLATSGG